VLALHDAKSVTFGLLDTGKLALDVGALIFVVGAAVDAALEGGKGVIVAIHNQISAKILADYCLLAAQQEQPCPHRQNLRTLYIASPFSCSEKRG
jgi:hypothetical protein